MNNQFVKESLLPDEKIIATAKFHGLKMWFSIIIFAFLFFLLFAFFFWFVLDVLLSINNDSVIIAIFDILSVIGAIPCAYKISKWLFGFDEFVITNKRVVAKVGVIRRIAFELQCEQVESIEIHQGIIGRILNYGTLMPCGIGASKVRIRFVVSPFEFRKHFYDLKNPQNT